MIMIRKVIYCNLLICSYAAVSISMSSCVNGEKKAGTESGQAVTDDQVTTIDALADRLIVGSWENQTPEQLEAHYKDQASAVNSYWTSAHQGEDQSKMNEGVCQELKALADSLSQGSTADMMRSGEINCAVSRYLTAQEYSTQHADNSLYQAEMRDWLQLEDKLVGFYRNLAELANWGGTISGPVAGKTLANLLQSRCDDYSRLKSGNESDGDQSTVAEARANLIQELEAAKELPDDIADEDAFRNKLKDMRESADQIVVLLDKWLASRAEMCKAEKISEGRTAQLVNQISQLVMELVEG